MQYKIYSRYQYYKYKEIVWCDWFILDEFDTKDIAENELAEFKKMSEQTDKSTKLKHQFKIE